MRQKVYKFSTMTHKATTRVLASSEMWLPADRFHLVPRPETLTAFWFIIIGHAASDF